MMFPSMVIEDESQKRISGFGSTHGGYPLLVSILLGLGLSKIRDEVVLECGAGFEGVAPGSDEISFLVDEPWS